MERRLNGGRCPRRPFARPGLPALMVTLATVVAGTGCYLPYPVPAGNVVDRRPGGPAVPDSGWGGSGCPLTLRQEVLERIDAIRRAHGLPSLRPHAELVRAAQLHTEYQANRDGITHTGPDRSVVGDRVEAAGYAYRSVGENVAGGYTTPEAAVAAWMDSPGHRAILLSPEPRHAGIGYAYRVDGRLHHFWTLVVAAPAEAEGTAAAGCHP